MVSGAVEILACTLIYAALATFLLVMIHKLNPQEKGLLITMVITATLCLWLFWMCTFMAQLNPLIGPEVKTKEFFLCDPNNPAFAASTQCHASAD